MATVVWIAMVLVVMVVLPVSEAERCGGKPLKDKHICCDEKRYARKSRSHKCCGKKYIPTATLDCCGGRPMNKETKVCCRTKIFSIKKKFKCCGHRYINTERFKCCLSDFKRIRKGRKCADPKCGTKLSNVARSLPGISQIVNGDDTTIEEHPWQVQLKFCDSTGVSCGICGGSIISDKWVLTAGHCVHDMHGRKATITIDAGSNEIHFGRTYKIKERVVYEGYDNIMDDGKPYDDVALLKIRGKFSLASYSTRSICLPDKSESFTGENCVISGWGSKSTGGGVWATFLQAATVPVVETQICTENQKYHDSILDTHLCVGYELKDVAACNGDSGGPLACQRKDGSWVLAGVASFIRKPTCESYAFYTRVTKYVEWIKTIIK